MLAALKYSCIFSLFLLSSLALADGLIQFTPLQKGALVTFEEKGKQWTSYDDDGLLSLAIIHTAFYSQNAAVTQKRLEEKEARRKAEGKVGENYDPTEEDMQDLKAFLNPGLRMDESTPIENWALVAPIVKRSVETFSTALSFYGKKEEIETFESFYKIIQERTPNWGEWQKFSDFLVDHASLYSYLSKEAQSSQWEVWSLGREFPVKHEKVTKWSLSRVFIDDTIDSIRNKLEACNALLSAGQLPEAPQEFVDGLKARGL